jgi:hypothetical protein
LGQWTESDTSWVGVVKVNVKEKHCYMQKYAVMLHQGSIPALLSEANEKEHLRGGEWKVRIIGRDRVIKGRGYYTY